MASRFLSTILGTAASFATGVCAAQPPAIDVATFNIRYGTADDGANAWRHRRENVFTTIRDWDADVIGVQEALQFQLDELLVALPEFRATGQGREGGTAGEHAAILFDHERFELLDSGDFWLSETPTVVASIGWDAALTRIVSWALLRERATGRAFKVWNAHFDHRGRQARLESAKLLQSRVAESPWPDIVLGDFNSVETSEPIGAMLANGKLVDAWRADNPNLPIEDSGTFGGFEGRVDSKRIDYVFVDPSIEVRFAEIDRRNFDGRDPSDHFPVRARLALASDAFVARYYDRDYGFALGLEPMLFDTHGIVTARLGPLGWFVTIDVAEAGPMSGQRRSDQLQALGFRRTEWQRARFLGRDVVRVNASGLAAPRDRGARCELAWMRGDHHMTAVLWSLFDDEALRDAQVELMEKLVLVEPAPPIGRSFGELRWPPIAGPGFHVDGRTLVDSVHRIAIELPAGSTFVFEPDATLQGALYGIRHRAPDVTLAVSVEPFAHDSDDADAVWRARCFGREIGFARQPVRDGIERFVATARDRQRGRYRIAYSHAPGRDGPVREWIAKHGLAAFSQLRSADAADATLDSDAAWCGDRVLRDGVFVDFASGVSWRKPTTGTWSVRICEDLNRDDIAFEFCERATGLRGTFRLERGAAGATARVQIDTPIDGKCKAVAEAARRELTVHAAPLRAVEVDAQTLHDRRLGVRLEAPVGGNVEQLDPPHAGTLSTFYRVAGATGGTLVVEARDRDNPLAGFAALPDPSPPQSPPLTPGVEPGPSRASSLGGQPSRLTETRRDDSVSQEHHAILGPGVVHLVTITGSTAERDALRQCYRAVFDPLSP